jgi:phage terminase large subunit GpA-like protein
VTFDLSTLSVAIADAHAVVEGAWTRGWELAEPLAVSAWADTHRYLTKEGAAEPGPWSTDRTPYLRAIMDALSDEHPAKKVVLMKCTQVGGTEVLNNFAGYVIHHSPGPTMVVMPTEKLAQRWSKQRLAPMISASPALRGLIAPATSRDGGNTTLMKEFPGGLLVIAGANSAADLRSMPARRILADEVDEYPEDLDDQGSPLELAERRASTFVRRKVLVCSSPKLKATSVVAREYEASDQSQYCVPCPHCALLQPLVIDQLTEDGQYLCVHCGSLIAEHHKPWMLSEDNGARWIARNPGSDVPGFHLNAMYAPLGLGYTWAEVAEMRAKAQRDTSLQVSFTNTILGLPFEGERQQQDAGEVARRAEETPRRIVPRGGLVLTIGVDCQHDRFAVCVCAWGREQRLWIVDYEEIPGDPSVAEGYADLDAFLQQAYAKASGALIVPRVVAIDGGNWTEQVAQFVRTRQQRLVRAGATHQQQRVMLVRGRSAKSDRVVYRPAKTEVNARGQTVARSVGTWGVGTDVAKHILYGRLAADTHAAEPEDRMVRFPAGLPETYYTGLTCEYFDLAARKWVKPKHARNEPLDTLVYGFFAALSPFARIDLIRDHEWQALEAALEPAADLFTTSPPAAPVAAADSRGTPPATPVVSPIADSRGTQPTRPAPRRVGLGHEGFNL